MYSSDREYFKNFKNHSNFVCNDSGLCRNEFIQIIEDTCNQIISEDESGVYDKCFSLVNLVINQSAIVMYRLYKASLSDEEELKLFLTVPKVLFGGLNEKDEPVLKYSGRRYMHQIQSNIKFVENDF